MARPSNFKLSPVETHNGERSITHKYVGKREDVCACIAAQPNGTRFYIRCYADARIEGKPDMIYSDALSASVQVSRATAKALAEGCASDMLENVKGARVPFSVYAATDSKYRAFYLF